MYDYKIEKGNKNLPQQCKPDIHPQQTKHEFGSIIFDSQFDSGNLEKVERNNSLKNNHFNLWICNDCRGTQKATNYRTWFYFSVTGVSAETTLTFTIMNLNFQNKMFREGMQPTYKSSLSNNWQRVRSNIASTMVNIIKIRENENNDNGLEITWTHKFDSPEEKIWFSFTYPFSYEDNEKFLKEYEQIYQNDSEIYMHRCTLIKSKEERKVELLTISSQTNKLAQQEKAIPNLFSDTESQRPAMFKNKKYVFFSARVHPGETPGSHVFNGIIKLLLNKDDPRAKALRDNFVFYCIPMINPDGVYRGHYRTDTNGLNLNRFYINPSLTEHPSVYAIKELILHLNETKRLHCYIDLHAHATKKGAFIYGNCLDLKDQLDTCLFPRLLSLNSPYFEYDSCNFTEKNMYCKDKGDGLSKEGAGRVALYKATKLNLCYTLECNYNTGTYTNKVFDYLNAQGETEKKEDQYDQDIIVNGIDLQPLKNTIYYTIEIFEQIGEGICDALLDYSSIHPNSRIPNTPYKSLANIKMRMAYNLMRITPFRFCQYLRKVLRYISINENLERVLKCLWIYLHTGIKNDIADNTKPIVQKVGNENTKLHSLKRQVTMQKKQITQEKNQTPNPSLLQKNINASQERKITQLPTSQLIGSFNPENEIKIISEMITNVNNLNKKRPLSQRQERQVSIFQDSNIFDSKQQQIIDTDHANQNDEVDDSQSEGGQDEKEERETNSLMQSYLIKNYNPTSQSSQTQHPYFSENNITQEYTPQSGNINREKIKKIVSNPPYIQRLEESFSQSLNYHQISDKIEDLINQQGKFAKQMEYQMPQLSIQEQYKLTSALPKRPNSKRLNHSYIRKNTIQQIQPVILQQMQYTNKPLSDLSNQNEQSYLLSNQNCTTNSNQNIFSLQSQPPNIQSSQSTQENKESLKFNMIKVSENKPYISEFDDRFAKIQNYQAQQSQKIEDFALKPKKIFVQQQQQQQSIVKQTRIIIDTLSKNKQRSESQKPYAVSKQGMQLNNNRSKSRNTQRIIPKKKVS